MGSVRRTDDPLEAAALRGRAASGAGGGGTDYTPAELAAMRALDHYKRHYRRPHPTVCEVLAVLRGIGWREPEGEHEPVSDGQ